MSDPVSHPAPGAAPWSPPLKSSRHDPERVRGALTAWLAERLGGADLQLGPLATPKANGVSNETVVVEAAWQGGAAAELVVRLQTDDPLYFENGVDRQYDVYRAVAGAPGVLVPGLVGFEPDPAVLGTPFYVMQRVPGTVPNDNPHYSLSGWVHDATPAERERLWRSAVAQLVAVHSVPVASVSFLDRPGAGPTGLAQDLAYWRAAYRWAAQGEPYDVMDAAEQWLLSSLPEVQSGLSWGDARIENMLFQDFEVTAMLDPESASLAGPGADLAWWALMDRGQPLTGIGSPRQTVALWEDLTGRRVDHLHYYLVLCAFRLSAVYIRLADQLRRRGQLEPDRHDLARRSEKMQQLALLLDLRMDGPMTARLPDVL